MEPKKNHSRQIYRGGKYVKTYSMPDTSSDENNFDDLFAPIDNEQNDTSFDFNSPISKAQFEEANIQINPNMTGDDEKRRMEAIKRAIEIARLMDNINVENLLKIAETVDSYLVG